MSESRIRPTQSNVENQKSIVTQPIAEIEAENDRLKKELERILNPSEPEAPKSGEQISGPDAVKLRAKQRNRGGISRRDTIVTSPLGITDLSGDVGKSIIGG